MLIHGPEDAERRTLTIAGVVLVVCVTLTVVLIATNPFHGRPEGVISVAIDTPFVGQGVTDGTALIAHGITVGHVTGVSNLPGGGVRVAAELQQTAVTGLTNSMKIDFRPVNYFGVAGINLVAGSGGQALHDGMQITTVPKGNFTLQALLSRLGEVSTGALTPQLIRVVDKATRYTEALVPLIETALIAGDAVARVQTVSTAQLLSNAAGLSVVLPSTANTLTDTGVGFLHNDLNFVHRATADYSDDEFEKRFIPTLHASSVGVFADIGRLESTHVGDLLPFVGATKAIFDVVPPLVRPEGFAQMLAELRSRFEKMYTGTPEQRALNVRIVLDNLPGVSAPVNAIGGP